MVISIHAPAKGATRQLVAYHHDWKISIHAPAKGATCGVPSRTQHNTISIHAPAKGATIRQQVDHHALKISIHAPAKGATDFTTREIILFRHFNPRSREGSDRTSIIKFIIIFYFNPRSRDGSDQRVPDYYQRAQQFQSTLPRRERRLWLRDHSRGNYFNPRSREGSDGTDLVLYLACNISIHAPAKGATYPPFGGLKAEEHFNPRSREGSDAIMSTSAATIANFNPRSREGSD